MTGIWDDASWPDSHGILDEDIYNFDETGFAMGLITTTKVVS
jgi:hypothetical protein